MPPVSQGNHRKSTSLLPGKASFIFRSLSSKEFPRQKRAAQPYSRRGLRSRVQLIILLFAMSMLIYNNIYSWEGWGGKLKLASGKCRLKIFDRSRAPGQSVPLMRPYVIVVTDVPDSKMSVRSCAGHIATNVTRQFDIDPQRTLYVEHYPKVVYGRGGRHTIPEHYVAVDFTWYEEKALNPKWRQLKSPLLDIVKSLVETGGAA